MAEPYASFCAALRVKNAGHLHDQLSSQLGVQPTGVTLRGEVSGALGRPASQDMWVLDAPLAEEEPLAAHLAWLANALQGKGQYLKQLVADGVDIDIFCGYRTNSDYSSFEMPAGAFNFAGDIGIPLHMSYVVA